ncbi:hypothetical protein Tco_1540264 [Tanacetum coccineum]
MGNNIEEWYIMPEGETFDLSVYETYTDYFSIKFHYARRFTDSPNKQCVDGEFAYVDMVNNADFRIDLLISVLCSLGLEDHDVINLYYKIRLKRLDIRLKPLVSENDTSSFLGYVHKQKMIYVYAELVKTTEDTSDENGEGDSEHDSEDGHCDANDIIDEKHLVEEIEVNMSAFNLQIEGEGEDGQVDSIQPVVTVIEDFLEVLDYDSLECD